MLFYLILGLAALLGFSLIRAGRRVFYQLAISSTSVLNVMLGNQDEEAKLEELQKETGRLIFSLFAFILLTVIAVAVIIGSTYAYALVQDIPFEEIPDWSGWQGVLAISIGATIPFLIPFKKGASGYSELAKLLHRMVLNNYHLGLKLHQRELKKSKTPKRKDFVIVSGLARAGTTSFMNKLSEDQAFRSLSYANMPFLLAPNTWAKFYKAKSGETKERSHKDGIQIGMDSNEALEEYFWKVRASDTYIGDRNLKEYRLSADDFEAYLNYQALIRQHESERYLAKNNNFLLRYESLRALNPDFSLILLFRDPLSHAASLLEKHLQYCELQDEDPFVLEYMDWLGHHEFGQHQKSFLFAGGQALDEDKRSLDFWLKLWTAYYQRALDFSDPNLLIIAYEDYCANPKEQLNRVLSHLGHAQLQNDIPAYTAQRKVDLKHDPTILAEAMKVYEELKSRL